MTNTQFIEMNKSIKTGNCIKYLAEQEINLNKVFTDSELKRVIKECNVNNITRKEIDFQKLLIQNKEYQEAQNNLFITLDNLKDAPENQQEKKKEEVLQMLDIRDKIYNKLKAEFNS